MELSIIFVMVLMVFLLVAADTARRFMKERGQWHQEDASRRATMPAKVVRTWWDNELFRNEVKKIYYALFELENGEQVKMRVPMSVYYDLFEREQGTLHYEMVGDAKLFREFQKE